MKDTRVVMVAGSSGIGRALCEKMAAQGFGHFVFVNDLPKRQGVSKVVFDEVDTSASGLLKQAAVRKFTNANPSFLALRKVDPREHDKKCWKDSKRYGKKRL